MIRPMTPRLVLLMLGLMATADATTSANARTPANVQAFLAEQFDMTGARLSLLETGRAVVQSLDAEDRREVGAVGAIRVRVPPAFYVAQLRDITNFKRSDDVLQIGRFSSPATLGDVAQLTLTRGDVEDLSRCRPRHCDVQLPLAAIERFRREVAWRTPAAAPQASQLMRQFLVDSANAYAASGDAGLVTYADHDQPVSVAQQSASLLASEPAVVRRFPELERRLTGVPQLSTAGADDLLYWSKERMGPAEIITVTHLAIAPVPDREPVAFAAASKQIYSTHYFDASIGITLLLADETDANATYLVYVNRSRIDFLHGMLAAVKRSLLRSRMRGAVDDSLRRARDRAERAYAQRGR